MKTDRGIRDFSIVLATLDGGRLVSDLTSELRGLNEELAKHAETQGKAKGELTVKFSISHAGGKVLITPSITVKTPKRVREDAVFWLSDDGELTANNPKQLPMFGELRGVEGGAANGTKAKDVPAERRVKEA